MNKVSFCYDYFMWKFKLIIKVYKKFRYFQYLKILQVINLNGEYNFV